MKKRNAGFGVLGVVIIIAIVAVVAVVAYVIWHGKGKGIGNGAGDGKGDGNTKVITNQTSSSNEESNTVVEEKKETQEQNENAMDTFEGTIIDISVYENDYLFNNENISLNELISKLQSIDGKIVIRIKDDNASLRAYDTLIKRLKKEKVDYVEQ